MIVSPMAAIPQIASRPIVFIIVIFWSGRQMADTACMNAVLNSVHLTPERGDGSKVLESLNGSVG